MSLRCLPKLLEAEDDSKDWIDANLDDVLTDEEDENSAFAISVVPCVEHEGNTYQLVDMPPGTEPQFWTVYKRIYQPDPDEPEYYEPGLEFALRDFNTPEAANAYAQRLKELYDSQGKLIEEE